jgi:hypothetical protein
VIGLGLEWTPTLRDYVPRRGTVGEVDDDALRLGFARLRELDYGDAHTHQALRTSCAEFGPVIYLAIPRRSS